MILHQVKTALELLEVWYKALGKCQDREKKERFKQLKGSWRRSQLLFKAKGLVAHDRHLTVYPRGLNVK